MLASPDILVGSPKFSFRERRAGPTCFLIARVLTDLLDEVEDVRRPEGGLGSRKDL